MQFDRRRKTEENLLRSSGQRRQGPAKNFAKAPGKKTIKITTFAGLFEGTQPPEGPTFFDRVKNVPCYDIFILGFFEKKAEMKKSCYAREISDASLFRNRRT